MSLVFISLVVALPFQPELGLRSETRAGRVPLGLGVDSISAGDVELMPLLGLRYGGPAQTLEIRYAPRIFQRWPDPLGRPLVLQRGMADYRFRPGPRWSGELAASFRHGETDYATAFLALGNRNLGASPDAALVRAFGVDGSGTLRYQASERSEWRSAMGAERLQPLAAPGESPWPAQSSVRWEGAHAYQASRRVGFETELRAEHIDFGDNTAIWQGRGLGTLSVRVLRAWRLEVAGGATMATVGGSARWLPEFRVAQSWGIGRGGAALESEFGWSAFVDPIAARVDPQLGARLGCQLPVATRWQLFFSVAGFATVPGVAPAAPQDLTQLFASTFARVTLGPELVGEFGFRGGLRGPELARPDFRLGSELLVGYAALNYRWGARRAAPSVAAGDGAWAGAASRETEAPSDDSEVQARAEAEAIERAARARARAEIQALWDAEAERFSAPAPAADPSPVLSPRVEPRLRPLESDDALPVLPAPPADSSGGGAPRGAP